MKTAIFGGSFNPVHSEHVNIARAAVSALGLERLIILPAARSPFKEGTVYASDGARLDMCRLAFGDIPCAEVSDFEIVRGGASYSYISCEHFKAAYPQDELYFIMGADMLESFTRWKFPERILACADIAVCARENESALEEDVSSFKARFGERIVNFGYVGGKVSSTRVRTLAALGESVREYVPANVAEYIERNSLYDLGTGRVREYLTESRYAHTVRVALKAAEMCVRFGIDERKAVTAAALHDCGKYLEKDSPALEGFSLPEGVPVPVPEPVMHQFTGAYVAANTFGVEDEDVLNAIRYHTSGRAGMSELEKLIYLSDMLEDGRDFPRADELRAEFMKGLDAGLEAALSHQMKYLASVGGDIYPLTAQAFGYIRSDL